MKSTRRALVSVSDKTGIVSLAQCLARHGYEIVSTGGTAKTLRASGVPITEISEVTGNPEVFGGRVKTLSFQVSAAILFDRERDRAESQKLGIVPIDVVVANLYPFAAHHRAGADLPTLIENIDVGGPTMIRAAAKNHAAVAVVTRPSQYAEVEKALDENGGAVPAPLRSTLARDAFRLTADYDAQIAVALAEKAGEHEVRLAFTGGTPLRYGENPHQTARFFRPSDGSVSLADVTVLGGKELSFNNLVDLAASLEAVGSLARNGCAIVKHANPCGLCEDEVQARALEQAWASDPVSAFGSVIAFNRPFGPDTARFFELDSPDKSRRKFVEVVAAPSFEPGAVELLKAHKALRIVTYPPEVTSTAHEHKIVLGALLSQSSDRELIDKLEVVTKKAPTADDRELVEFGVKAVRAVKSNAIVIVRRTEAGALQLLGMGAGQPNRVASTRLAIERARATLESGAGGAAAVEPGLARSILVSDAFFPFPDSIELCASAGIVNVYQPGGSIRDRDVIERCDQLGIAMVMTGRRHFRH